MHDDGAVIDGIQHLVNPFQHGERGFFPLIENQKQTSSILSQVGAYSFLYALDLLGIGMTAPGGGFQDDVPAKTEQDIVKPAAIMVRLTYHDAFNAIWQCGDKAGNQRGLAAAAGTSEDKKWRVVNEGRHNVVAQGSANSIIEEKCVLTVVADGCRRRSPHKIHSLLQNFFTSLEQKEETLQGTNAQYHCRHRSSSCNWSGYGRWHFDGGA
jgi:hypothetical protein